MSRTLAILVAFVASVTADDCIDYMNSLRAQQGHDALTQSFDQCANDDASYDAANGPHSSFGNCGEAAQNEAQNMESDGCHSSIDQFYSEGPGGGHYDTMMSDSYCTVEWGSCSQCYSYQGFDLNFFTFNFYPCSEHVNSAHASEIQSGSKVLQSATIAELSSSIKRTTANSTIVNYTPQDEASCLAAVNKYRGMAGKGPLQMCASSFQEMAQTESKNDAANGFHNWVNTKGWSGTCAGGKEGQCEAAGPDTQDGAVKMYYDEGPGGGHYDILMSDYTCVACGWNTGISSYNNFYTHNFCGNSNKQTGGGLHTPAKDNLVV